MAVDEALAESASRDGTATLRFYQWSEPTLSLGYFQAASAREQHLPSRDCPLVRRSSGGGAIVHDRELTYSLAIPIDDRLLERAEKWYDGVHQTLVHFLEDRKIPAKLCCRSSSLSKQEQPFLCFERHSCGDVLLRMSDNSGLIKIAGSAQRRLRKSLLQHGSVLLAASPQAPELPGLLELADPPLTSETLVGPWSMALGKVFNITMTEGTLTGEEQERAQEIQKEKYANDDWTFRR